jgi:serine/threonine protein phosphatase 1
MDSGRLIAIGDVHGCCHALDTVLDAIAPNADDRIVFVGDLVDQGKESKEVLERILRLQHECDVVLIKGNHEEMMFAALESEAALRYWERCGGVATLNSYRFGGKLCDIPAGHWALLESCVPYFETDEYIFTHANYLADTPMNEQPEYTLRWALFDSLKERPHFSGKTVVVGHTEQKSAEILDLGFAMCIDTACWKYGWLTAIDVLSGEYWQASRWGVMRDGCETSHRHRLKELLKPVDSVTAAETAAAAAG